MTTKHIQHMLAVFLLGTSGCASDASPKSKGASDAVESGDDDTDTKAETKPLARDAGTQKKDAGKPEKRDAGHVEDTGDEVASEQGADPVVDAGRKPAPAVDAGHADHVASGAADASSLPATPGAPGAAAMTFCGKYKMYCGYGKMNRHADENACLADFEGNPLQQGCKVMHLDTAIAGTAAACNGMASEFCFSIHCLHATGITDPTGVTYCK